LIKKECFFVGFFSKQPSYPPLSWLWEGFGKRRKGEGEKKGLACFIIYSKLSCI